MTETPTAIEGALPTAFHVNDGTPCPNPGETTCRCGPYEGHRHEGVDLALLNWPASPTVVEHACEVRLAIAKEADRLGDG